MSNFRGAILLLVLACMWSSSFTTIKYVVYDLPPLTLVAVRLTIASAILYFFVRLQRDRLPTFGPSWVPFFLIGLTGNSLPFFLISWGEVGISSAQAVILLALMPLATLVLAHFFTQSDKITGTRLVGLIAGFGGVVLLLGPDIGTSGASGEGATIYRIAVVGAAMCYAIAAVQVRRLPKYDNPVIGSTAMMICAMVQMIPLSLAMDQPWNLSPDAGHIAATVYLGVVPTALAAILYFKIITEKGTAFFAVINYIIPCLGVLWGYLFLGEYVDAQSLMALAVILGGMAIANLGRETRG